MSVADLHPTPLSDLRISKHQIPAHNLIPNSSLQAKPLIIYHSAFSSSDASADQIESHLLKIGVVTPQWRYTMYDTTHFHSTTHEVLCVAAGRAKLCFGGEHNPGRVEPVVKRGDVIVVPAGVSHRLLEDMDGDHFLMVGSYPNGKDWDMCYGDKAEESKINNIKGLSWFNKDPIYGDEGPVLDA
ncbi:cupin domain-containing [Trichoderma arundinaceum]|uniref:Cupin domain-containing n=1 Tax=Trichoderma arundinaceum TaxID=490622 RepID=A0A395NJB3_TRIAR|nr:cupin domain-containing [Trichoderma arundinaceum]